MITMRRHVEVDKRVRTDINYPAGFMDVVEIAKTDERFRLLYDVKGRFTLHRIGKEEANFKLLRIVKKAVGKKVSIGRNPTQSGQAGAIPYCTTHDGRTIRFADPIWKPNDSVKFDLSTGKVVGHYPFEAGQVSMITRGANVGRVGEIISIEKHPGSNEIVHLRDKKGNNFATRVENVFVIGQGKDAAVSLPKRKGIQLSIMEERDMRNKGKSE